MQQALQTKKEVKIGERTADKVIQASEQRAQDPMWIRPCGAKKPEERGRGPVSPEGAERLGRGLL
jgi:hypothetical protein